MNAMLKNFAQFLALLSFNFERERCYHKASGTLSGEDQNRFLQAAEQQKWPRDKAIAISLRYTGLRTSEWCKPECSKYQRWFFLH